MPTPCNYVHTDLECCQGVHLKRAPHCARQGRPEKRPAGRGSTSPARPSRFGFQSEALRLQDGDRGRLIGDQPVDQATLQRRSDRRDFGGTDGGANGQGFRVIARTLGRESAETVPLTGKVEVAGQVVKSVIA